MPTSGLRSLSKTCPATPSQAQPRSLAKFVTSTLLPGCTTNAASVVASAVGVAGAGGAGRRRPAGGGGGREAQSRGNRRRRLESRAGKERVDDLDQARVGEDGGNAAGANQRCQDEDKAQAVDQQAAEASAWLRGIDIFPRIASSLQGATKISIGAVACRLCSQMTTACSRRNRRASGRSGWAARSKTRTI